MSNDIVLYDLARRGAKNTCWSWNVWKIRQVLNYKHISYTTTWLTHPEIGPTLSAFGIPSNDTENGSPYTVPTIRLPTGEYIMESLAIVQKLESLYPNPSIHLSTTPIEETRAAIRAFAGPLVPVFMPRIGRGVIREDSVVWFHENWQANFGMMLEEFEACKGGELAWQAARAKVGLLNKLLADHKLDEGPSILGSTPTYADFMLVGMLEGLRRIGQDIFERSLGGMGSLDSCMMYADLTLRKMISLPHALVLEAISCVWRQKAQQQIWFPEAELNVQPGAPTLPKTQRVNPIWKSTPLPAAYEELTAENAILRKQFKVACEHADKVLDSHKMQTATGME
ncbi:hypothetical protein LTR17_025495 [Elasticomyces elasticus]|nr:hypothetical protein LTR17_025495 [Elasticomyces elasticus]